MAFHIFTFYCNWNFHDNILRGGPAWYTTQVMADVVVPHENLLAFCSQRVGGGLMRNGKTLPT